MLLTEHQGEIAVFKLRYNKPLTKDDVNYLEKVLWNELGTSEEYENEYGDAPIAKLVRQVVGLDSGAVNVAFSEFLSEERLNVEQVKFVRLIIDYVVDKGYLERPALQDAPFRTLGSISELIENNTEDVKEILVIIDRINENIEVIERP